MLISAAAMRLGLCVFLILGMAIITTSKAPADTEDECFYYYIQQPNSNVSCNPWPYFMSYSGNALVLHCDLLGPQNNDIPNIEWYRSLYSNNDNSKPQRIHYGRGKGKFSTPTSSGDIPSGFKRINFTLFVNDISEADAGCYWCEIRAKAGKCSFCMKRSSVFCLQKVSAYGDREDCPILPVNNSVVCASDTTCEDLPANLSGDPYPITDDIIKRSGKSTQAPSPSQPIVPANNTPSILTDIHVTSTSKFRSNSIIGPLSSLHTNQKTSTFTTHSAQPTSSLSYQSCLVTNKVAPVTTTSSSTLLTSHVFPQISPAADYATKIVNLSPSTSTMSKSIDYKQVTTVSSSPIMMTALAGSGKHGNSTMELSLPLTWVQISVFIGIAVCTVLFAVISVLVFGVVMLCKKTTPKSSSRNNHMHHGGEGHHILSNSPAELISTVWRGELEESPVRTSVVNTELALPPSSVPSYSSIRVAVTNEDEVSPSHARAQDQPTMMSLPVTSPLTPVPMPTLPSHVNMEFRWRAYSLPLLTDRTGTISHGVDLRQNQHHLSLEGNRESRLDYQQIESNVASISSPELHYYHVLERPEYYNCIWLEGEDGRELLLGETNRSNQLQRVTIKEDDSDSDSQYHWRVVLTSSGQDEGQQGLDRSTSSKRVGRHLYRRLDHSTMEPFQDYAKVSIASEHHDSNADSQRSHA